MTSSQMRFRMPVQQSEDFSKIVDHRDHRLPRYRMFGRNGDEKEANPNGILAPMSIMTFAILSRYLALKISKIPYQLFLLIICMILAAVYTYSNVLDPYDTLIKVNAYQYEELLMPLLIMRITLTVDLNCAVRLMYQITVISIPRFLVEMVCLGYLMVSILTINTNFYDAIIFGVIVTPVYPSSIVYLVKDLSTFKHLGTIIQMETLITMALSKTIYILCLSIKEEVLKRWYHIVLFLIRDIVGGLLFGYIFGKGGAFMASFFHSESSMVITFYFSLSYVVNGSLTTLGVSNYIGMVTVGMLLANERPKLTPDTEKSLLYFWECAYHFVYTITFLGIHLFAAVYLFEKATDKFFASIVILYVSTTMIRFLSFTIIYPIINRMGYGMTVPGIVVLSLTNSKDVPNMLFAIWPVYHPSMNIIAPYYVTHTLLVEALSLLINFTFMGSLMDLLGVSDVSQQRRTNMNNCLKFIWKKRALFLPLLKCNRFYAAANWDSINQATIIKHPYKVKATIDDSEDSKLLSVEATCPDCSRTFFMEKNTTERLNVLKEVYSRIIKAKRVLYIRLYENGLLSKESKWLLLYMLDATRDSNIMEFRISDYIKFIHIPNLLRLSKFLRRWRRDPDETIVVPKQKNRQICYYIVMHQCFIQVFNYIMVLQLILAILFHVYRFAGTLFVIYYMIRILLVLIFWGETIAKTTAYSHISFANGFRTYLRPLWRKVVFSLNIALTIKISLDFIWYQPIEEQPIHYGPHVIVVISYMEYIDWLYAIRLLKLTRYILKRLANIVDQKIDKKYSDGYDLGKAIVTGDTELLEMLPSLVEDDHIRTEISKSLEARRDKVNSILGETAKQRPSIAVSVKTRQATHSILNVLKQSVQELRQAGYIDSIEFNKLMLSIERLVTKLQGMRIISPSAPNVLFREIPWMGQDKYIINFLYRNVMIRNYDSGAVVVDKGHAADGISVVVTGLLKLKYVPLTENELMGTDIGAILIIDYLSTLYFQEEIDDFIVSGNSIGELSVLTKRPYSCTITADSAVQVYHISKHIMSAAMLEYNDPVDGLQCRLWKSSCFHLASRLLLSSPQFQYHTAEQVKEYVDRAFVPELSDIQIVLLNDLIQDVLLIDGLVADCITKEVYLPPYYIPRTCQKLLLNKESCNLGSKVESRLMIIPLKDMDPVEILKRITIMHETPTKELITTIRNNVRYKFGNMYLERYSQVVPSSTKIIEKTISSSHDLQLQVSTTSITHGASKRSALNKIVKGKE